MVRAGCASSRPPPPPASLAPAADQPRTRGPDTRKARCLDDEPPRPRESLSARRRRRSWLPATAAATTAAAAPAAGALLGLVDRQGTAHELTTVQVADRGRCLGVRRHLDEAEAARTAGVAIHDQLGLGHRARVREQVAQVHFRGVEREISYVESLAHRDTCQRPREFSADHYRRVMRRSQRVSPGESPFPCLLSTSTTTASATRLSLADFFLGAAYTAEADNFGQGSRPGRCLDHAPTPALSRHSATSDLLRSRQPPISCPSIGLRPCRTREIFSTECRSRSPAAFSARGRISGTTIWIQVFLPVVASDSTAVGFTGTFSQRHPRANRVSSSSPTAPCNFR